MELKCTCPHTRWEQGAAPHEPGCPIGDWISGKPLASLPVLDVVAAEELARLFHDTYIRLAPAFGWLVRLATATSWEKLPKNNRLLMIATATEVLRALDNDPGEQLAMLVSKQGDGKIRVDFQSRVKWFAIEKDHAVNFALTILQHCGVPVSITLNPPPESSGAPV